MELYKEFSFESAHFLPMVEETHKCRNMHGHSYKLTVHLTGNIDERLGWVIDFNDIKKAVLPLVDMVDHKVLNEIKGLENPTAENLAVWFWQNIKPKLPALTKTVIAETATSGCIYTGQ